MNQQIMDKVTAIAERVGESEGIEIVEVEVKGTGRHRLLRILIDKPAGVTHADCETISRQVGTILDVEDPIPGQYTLEVSSPGVERKLSRERDFTRFLGSPAKVKLRQPVAGKTSWQGVISACEGGKVTITSAEGPVVEFSLDQLDRANLVFEW